MFGAWIVAANAVVAVEMYRAGAVIAFDGKGEPPIRPLPAPTFRLAHTNCVNCGAPAHGYRCSYCGTQALLEVVS